MKLEDTTSPPNLSQIAGRFFLGDVATLTALAKGYGSMT